MTQDKPDFIIIGAQKSGTTWLHRELSAHPEIVVPEKKELHFFDNNKVQTQERTDQYLSMFGSDATKCRGEATPSYLAHPHAARKIHDLLPKAKLIVVLRQPAERAYSQWRMLRFRGKLADGLSFTDAFEQDLPRVLSMKARGMYARQLERYYSFFSAEQVKVLFYDDMKKDPRAFIVGVHQFLGVDESFVSGTHEQYHPTTYSDDKSVPSRMTRDEWQHLTDFYDPEISSLETLLSVDLSSWRSSRDASS